MLAFQRTQSAPPRDVASCCMSQPTAMTMLRQVVVAAQATTIAITWPLWQPRTSPPLLPVAALANAPALSFGAALLASLLVTLRWPRTGALLHSLLLGAAMLFDQTREQPQLLSLALLLWATVPGATPRALGAAQIIALWFWSGLGKLCSPRFLTEGGAFLVGLPAGSESTSGTVLAIALGCAEIALAVLALMPRWRRHAGIAGCLLHAGILLVLSPLGRNLNPSVWPWNAALMFAAPILLGAAPTTTPAAGGARIARRCVAGFLFALLPLGFHAGCVDAPFASQVYTLNEPRALVLHADGASTRVGLLPDLRVFVPAVPRIQLAWFERSARTGDRLVLLEPRPLARWLGAGDRLIDASANPAEEAAPARR